MVDLIDSWRYEGKAGEIAKILDEAPFTGTYKFSRRINAPTTMPLDFQSFTGRNKFPNGLSTRDAQAIAGERYAQAVADRIRYLGNVLLLEERPAQSEGILEALSRSVSMSEPKHFLSICGIPLKHSDDDKSFSSYYRDNLGTAHFNLNFAVGMKNAREIIKSLKIDPTLLNDVMLRMGEITVPSSHPRLVTPVNLYYAFMLDPRSTWDKHELEETYKKLGGKVSGIRGADCFPVSIVSESGFDQY